MGLFILYFSLRFLPYLCSPALDDKIGMGESWTLTRGNGLRILAIVILVHLPFTVLSMTVDHGFQARGTLVGSVLTAILGIVGMMLAAFESAIIYKALVDRSAPLVTTAATQKPNMTFSAVIRSSRTRSP
jgi:hypothetical protein